MHAPTPLALITVAGVIFFWLCFAAIFLLRKRPPQVTEARRNKAAGAGIGLQMLAYFLVFFQPPWQPFLPTVAALSGARGIVFAVFTLAIAAASIWLIASAVRSLGKQWAVQARLVEDHKLITDDPYAYIRNPIYTGMLGMLIATGLALEHWIALILAVILFAIGLVIRIRSEEKLLRSAFGPQFEEYARRVPAVIPGIY